MKTQDIQIFTGTDFTPELDTYNPYYEKSFKSIQITNHSEDVLDQYLYTFDRVVHPDQTGENITDFNIILPFIFSPVGENNYFSFRQYQVVDDSDPDPNNWIQAQIDAFEDNLNIYSSIEEFRDIYLQGSFIDNTYFIGPGFTIGYQSGYFEKLVIQFLFKKMDAVDRSVFDVESQNSYFCNFTVDSTFNLPNNPNPYDTIKIFSAVPATSNKFIYLMSDYPIKSSYSPQNKLTLGFRNYNLVFFNEIIGQVLSV